jgi:arsenite-transporting ATPase
MSLPQFLTDPDLQLLLFGGKGGVGKTTCAAAAGLELARRLPGRPVVLVSTDPAHSLADSLAGLPLPAGMEVVEFDARAHLEDFRRHHGRHLQAIAERGTFLDDEDIGRFLSLSLPGMDELFGFLDLARRAESAGEHERIVVDTAPSGHTLRLLGMPELLRGWVNVLQTLLAKHRYMKRLFGHTYVPDELDRFLDELTASIATAEALLTDTRRCRFVPVMIAEELSVRETGALLDELARLRIEANELVVNLLSPASGCPNCAGMRRQQWRELGHLPASFEGRALWGAPLRPDEVRGAALETFWDDVAPLDPRAPPTEPPPEFPEAVQLVDAPAPLPPAGARLLLFAGKGGVGKTTLACATALRLARAWPQRRLLLFSTDPAHSLADCLDRPVGPQASPVAGNLMALQIDAPAELASLKQQYWHELDEFFGSMLGGFDLPFDREVMERIIELSPPGLDEIMALTRAMEFLSAGTYDLLVLDAAPTGHFVRLLEMPQLVDDWLKAFFELFLKYRRVFGMPRLAARLVQMSRDLHRFRALLRDPERCAVMATSIPTRMALEETLDLAAACRRIGVNLASLFLNRMTPESGCPFCARVARRERELERDFARSFPGHRTAVFRQPEPRGRGSWPIGGRPTCCGARPPKSP